MNGRIYDQRLGRFLSVDPVFDNLGMTQGVNAYSYVRNNPVSYTDPSGLQTVMSEFHHSDSRIHTTAYMGLFYGTGGTSFGGGMSTWTPMSNQSLLNQSFQNGNLTMWSPNWVTSANAAPATPEGSLRDGSDDTDSFYGLYRAMKWAEATGDSAAVAFMDGKIDAYNIRSLSRMGFSDQQLEAYQTSANIAREFGRAPWYKQILIYLQLSPHVQAGGAAGISGLGRAAERIPLGMKPGQLSNALSRIEAAAGVDDAVAGLRGSSVIGISRSRGLVSAPADYDFLVVSDKLFYQGIAAGAQPSRGALRVSATMKFFPGLHAVERTLTTNLGLKSTIRIFSTEGFKSVQTGGELLSR